MVVNEAKDKGGFPVVQYLSEQRADMEARGTYGRTLLHLATYEGDVAVVQYLCELGADKEARGTYGRTLLQIAGRHGNLDVQHFQHKQELTWGQMIEN